MTLITVTDTELRDLTVSTVSDVCDVGDDDSNYRLSFICAHARELDRLLAMLAVGLLGAQQGLLENDLDVLRRDPERKCLPPYLASFQTRLGAFMLCYSVLFGAGIGLAYSAPLLPAAPTPAPDRPTSPRLTKADGAGQAWIISRSTRTVVSGRAAPPSATTPAIWATF